jgi:hypothetical protein
MAMDWLKDFAQWLYDVLMWLPRWTVDQVLSGLAALIQAIPVPSFINDFMTSAASLSGDVVWWLDLLQVQWGLSCMTTALIARFVLRRIPLIGG